MRTTLLGLVGVVALGLWAQPAAQVVTNDGPYKITQNARLNYAASAHIYDPALDRIYSSTRGGIYTVDGSSRKVLGQTANVRGTGSMALDAARGELYMLALHEDALRVVDVTTHKVVRSFPAPAWFNVFYEPGRGELYYLRGDKTSMQVADRVTGKTLATVDLGGRPAYLVDDQERHRLLVRLADQPKIQVIDTVDHSVTASWASRRDGATSMAFDAKHNRLFTTAGKDVVLLDGATGAELGRAPTSDIAYSMVYDADAGYLLALSGGGEVTVIKADGTTLKTVQRLDAAAWIQDLYLDSARRRVIGLSRVVDENLMWDVSAPAPVNGPTAMITFARK